MKKTIILSISMFAVMLLTSCGGGDDGVASAPTNQGNQGGGGNSPASSLSVTFVDEITLTDGHMVYMTFSQSVKGYHLASLAKSDFDRKTAAEIISELKAREKHEDTNGVVRNYATNLPAGSTRVLCMVCYDANGNYGDLVTRTYVTKSATDVWDAPCQLTGTETEWRLNVTRQNNCAKYYLLTNANAQQVAELIGQPNILLARSFKKQMDEHADFVPRTDDINTAKTRSSDQTVMFAMTWGQNVQGEFSGNICKASASIANNATILNAPWYNVNHSAGLFDNYYDDI